MKLPIEASLLVLGFLGRQTLGRLLVTNRRLGGIVNRHRKTLNLPEIPIPPRLSTSLKCVALLAVVTLLLLPVAFRIVCARRFTHSRLRAAGLVREVPESFRNGQRFREVSEHAVECTRTCDSQWRCHAECHSKYTLRGQNRGTITKQNCSIAGLPTTNTSPSIDVAWNCSFDYAVNAETTADIEESQMTTFEWHLVVWTRIFLAMVASAYAVKLHRMDGRIADDYKAATSGPRRDRALEKHENLRQVVVGWSVAGFVFAGLCGAPALYGMTFQTFSDDVLFIIPLVMTCGVMVVVALVALCLLGLMPQ